MKIPGIAWVIAGTVALLVVGSILARRAEDAPLEAAHQVTQKATQAAAAAETVFVHDTVRAKAGRGSYAAKRDTALVSLTDTVTVKAAFAAADNALLLDSTAIASGARTIQAQKVLVASLRTELAISERLRAPRFRVSSYAGADVDAVVPLTGIEGEVRVTRQWSAVVRIEKRWAAGEGTRRLVLIRYAL